MAGTGTRGSALVHPRDLGPCVLGAAGFARRSERETESARRSGRREAADGIVGEIAAEGRRLRARLR